MYVEDDIRYYTGIIHKYHGCCFSANAYGQVSCTLDILQKVLDLGSGRNNERWIKPEKVINTKAQLKP
ncbi:hypothetical protein A4A49_25522 [Nicotiana attenuata]|uniref:Uncharacterized protein n=1 Tax=Nicotiana attenuata TaxID=49451 RepID=A0A314L1V6_NICAT|nr:hypothetical protein A4A49_25522 [Nicotiana attenuata]